MADVTPISMAQFVRAVAILALPADDQIRWLNSLGLPGVAAIADELGQEFDDGFILLPQFVEMGWMSSKVAEKLTIVNLRLSEMFDSEDPDLWRGFHAGALCGMGRIAADRKRRLVCHITLMRGHDGGLGRQPDPVGAREDPEPRRGLRARGARRPADG